jgi:hypothetical protein
MRPGLSMFDAVCCQAPYAEHPGGTVLSRTLCKSGDDELQHPRRMRPALRAPVKG